MQVIGKTLGRQVASDIEFFCTDELDDLDGDGSFCFHGFGGSR